ncbi:unnamed protein product [Phytomonas sp. EM1]|nr:unnamed protein product [Phytomonas sp. EM1]|eukprot:CCW65152.1 unnamed protein product [Phytomonas sp. isolate EM1]
MNSTQCFLTSHIRLGVLHGPVRGAPRSFKLSASKGVRYPRLSTLSLAGGFSIIAEPKALRWPPILNIARSSSTVANQSLHREDLREEPSSWWLRTYHRAFFAPNERDDGGEEEKGDRTKVECLLPMESGEVLRVTRGICTALSSLLSEGGEALREPSDMLLVREMQAVLLFIIHHRLRYFMIPPFQPPGEGIDALGDKEIVGELREAVETSSDASLGSPNPSCALQPAEKGDYEKDSSFLGVRRAACERVDDLTAPVPPRVLSTAESLVGVVKSILDLPPTAVTRMYHTHSVLYELLLTPLGVVEQLTSSTIALVATCMARCAEGYAVRLHLSAFTSDDERRPSWEGGNLVEEEEEGGKRLLRMYLDQDALLATQAEQMTKFLADFQPGVNPVVVISHFNILCRVVRKRMEDFLAHQYAEWKATSANFHNSKTKEIKYLKQKDFWDRVKGPAGSDSSLVAAVERRQRAEEAKLRLLPLEERKKKNVEGGARPRRRRAVGNVIAEKSQSTVIPPPDHAKACESREFLDLTLSDVATIASAVGFLRYADSFFWEVLTTFTCWRLSLAETEDLELDHKGWSMRLREVRDIAYALDYARQRDHYTRLMEELVRMGWLSEPIPPPSMTVQAMQSGVQ